uniref:Uncharacterized protein n=1 Tax=Arundo donax TaxID=35708 RepID=A0A0A8ZQI5_ARUDO
MSIRFDCDYNPHVQLPKLATNTPFFKVINYFISFHMEQR